MSYTSYTEEHGFCGFLKNWLTRRRLSQLDLSLQSGMSQRHISFLETGRSMPSRFAISQLAAAINDLRIETLLPANEATRDWFRQGLC